MRTARREHPVKLPWYAGGNLEAAEAASIDRHLETCDACRAEVDALRTVYDRLRAPGDADHPTPDQLVAYHDGALESDERSRLAAHVRTCAPCAADLAAVERAEVRVRPRSRSFLAAAASLLIVAALGWRFTATTPTVVFPPALRDGSGSSRLTGSGPWSFEVWPPLLASESRYVARIQHGGDVVFETIVTPSPKGGKVLFEVSGPLPPGHYVLALIPHGGDGTPIDVRGFDVGPPR